MKNIENLINAGIPEVVLEKIAEEIIDEDSYKINILAHDKRTWEINKNRIDHCLYLQEKSEGQSSKGFLYVVQWLEGGIINSQADSIKVNVIHSYDLKRLQSLIN